MKYGQLSMPEELQENKEFQVQYIGKSLIFHFENLFARDVLYKEGNHHFSAISCQYTQSSLWIYIKKISLTQREFTLLFKLRTVRLFHFFIAQHLLRLCLDAVTPRNQ